MGIVFRQSAKSTIVIFTGAILGAIVNLVYAYIFTKAELGLVTNLVNQAAIVQVFVLTGLAYLLVTYFPRYPENDPKRNVLLTICFAAPIITLLLFSIPYFLFKEKIINIYNIEDRHYINRYYIWLPVIVLGWAYTNLLDHYLVSRMRAAAGAVVREFILRGATVVLIGLFFFRLIDFDVFVGLLSIVYLAPVFIGFIFAIRTAGFSFSFNFKVFSRSEYKKLFHFSGYHLLEGVSVTLMGYVDALMLAPLSNEGLSDLSIYRNAVFIASLMIMPFRAMSAASFPIFNMAYTENKRTYLQEFYKRNSLNTLTVGLGIFLIVACNMNNVVMIFPEGYEKIKEVTLVLILGKLIHMSAGMSSELISLSKFYRFNFFTSLMLLIVIVILNRLLIPTYGIMGAAWSTTISLSAYNIIKVIFIQKKLKLQTHSHYCASVLIFGTAAGAIGWILPFMANPIMDAGIRTIVIVVIYASLLMWLQPNSDFSQLLRKVVIHRRFR